MGSSFSMIKMHGQKELEAARRKAEEIVSSAPVAVFSKTYCGYCKRVKQLLIQMGATFKVVELDEEKDGNELQLALAQWTGQRTVPNVFIGGKHIGDSDAVMEKYQEGELLALLAEARAIPNPNESAQAQE